VGIANGDVSVNVPAPIPASVSVPGGAGCGAAVAVSAAPGQTVLTVGAGGMFQTVGAAVAAAANGDLILVQPGTYVNDFADVTAQVTIAGAGGMVNLVATEAPPNEKGIFVVDASCTIENLSFQGVAISDSEGGNGAGIRYQGGNLVLNNDSFIGNQNGILAAAVDGLAQNTVTITNTTFDANGQSSGPNAGYTHNAYISNGITSLVAEHDVFERAQVGHELKSRAETNLISDNIFYDGPGGTASYSIDLPDGGADTVSGNVIEKGPLSENNAVIHFGGEGIPYAGSSLLVQGNVFVNDLGPQALGVLNQTTLNVVITGNQFDSFAAGALASGAYGQSGNVDQNGNPIAAAASTDFAPGTNVDDFSADSAAHSLTLNSSMGVRGGGGLLTVQDDVGHVTVLGGTGGLDFVEQPGWGGSYIATASAAADTVVALGQDVVDSEGNDSIVAGGGDLYVQVNGAAQIASGDNNNAYVVNGTAHIQGNGGSDTVQVDSSGAQVAVSGNEGYFQTAVNAGSIGYSIMQGGALQQATISGGGVLDRVYNGGANVTTAGGAGAAISFGAGTVTACFSHGADTIHAGSGADTVIVSASARVYAGTGLLSVFGRSEGGVATVYGAAGTVVISGDSGGIWYQGGATANTVVAALSNISVTGGAGLMSVVGGSDQYVAGGSGGMVFSTAGGADNISTQAGARDRITMQGACVVTSNGHDTITDTGGNATITANGYASILGSPGNAFYTLNGQDTLDGNGYTRATVGAAANDTVISYGTLTSVNIEGGRLVFCQDSNADGETATVSGAGASLGSSSSGNVTNIDVTAKGDRVVLGGGHEAVTASGGAMVTAGSGQDTVGLYTGGEVVRGGGGEWQSDAGWWHGRHKFRGLYGARRWDGGGDLGAGRRTYQVRNRNDGGYSSGLGAGGGV
jgi:hypothetical protein